MLLPDKLTDEQSAALICCLRILAELGDDERIESPNSLAAAGDSARVNVTLMMSKDVTDAA